MQQAKYMLIRVLPIEEITYPDMVGNSKGKILLVYLPETTKDTTNYSSGEFQI